MTGRNRITVVILACAAIIGVVIGYVDSRPTWDDTGITVSTVFMASAILAALRPRYAWLVGLLVGAPVFVFNVAATGTFAPTVAIVIGLIGAGAGCLVGRAMTSGAAPNTSG